MERVGFRNSRGQKLIGDFHKPSKTPAASIIITHGFRGTKEGGGKAILLAEELATRGYAVLRFDFAGVGDSEGDFSDITLTHQVDDLITAVNWVKNCRIGQDLPLIGLGRSFGGSTLLVAAQRELGISGVCLWSTSFDLPSTFSSILGNEFELLKSSSSKVKLYDEKGEFSLKSEFVKDLYQHDLWQVLPQLHSRPILIVHGEEDEVVEVKQAKRAYQLAAEPKEIKIIKNGDHRFLLTWEQAWQALFKWLDKYYPLK